MPRRKEEVVYMEDRLTVEEAEILRIAARGERFVIDGWKKFGSDWPKHLPRMEYFVCHSCDEVFPVEYSPEDAGSIYVCPDCLKELVKEDVQLLVNIATKYLFNWQFQRYQAELHYCPIRDRNVFGGRGCGKTETLAISSSVRTILWPGHDWLHVAPSLDQAKLTYFFLIKQAKMGKFWDLFVKDYHTHPLPEIFLHPMNEFDPGTRWLFRTIGDSLERVRGERVGIVSVDEGFRLFPTDWYVGVLAGCARGVNEYSLNMNSDLSDQYQSMVREIEWEMNPLKQRQLQRDLDAWVVSNNLSKHTTLTMIGNAPYHMVWWNRFKKGEEKPWMRWSKRWTSHQNLFLSEAQVNFWAQQFTDPDALAVELEAAKPKASGDVFPYLEDLFLPQLDDLAVKMVEDKVPGWVYKTHQDYGLYHYEKPAEKDGVYVFGADPGAGKLPGRNKWVIIGARIDNGPPFEVVYFHAGSLPGKHGSIDPWIQASQYVLEKYNILQHGYAAEAGGPQRHVHTVVWPDDLYIIPLNMNQTMATEVLKLQRMLIGSDRYGCMFHMPGVAMAEIELAEFKLSMKKTDPQDVVVAMLALANRAYPWVAEEWEKAEDELPERDDFWESLEIRRDIRDFGREVRRR